ncbi:hypothetical protein [Lacinutrix chionoecetis]
MKSIKLASVFILTILFSTFYSCQNEPLDGFDLNSQNASNNLIGTWTLTTFSATVNTSSDVGGMTIESDVVIQSINPNYDLTFTPSTYTTSGGYGYDVDITVNGQTSSQTLSVDNVSGSGNYTTNGSELTSDGSFVSYEFQGMDFSDFDGPQTSPYTISPDGQTLSFSQNTTETTNEGGFTVTSTVSSSSVWTKISNTVDPCVEATTFATTAENQYNNDPTNENVCNAYKSALQNLISACGDATGEIQSVIDGLGDCTGNNQPSEVEISLTVGTLPIEFDLVDVVVQGTTLQVTGETSAQNNYSIYFEVEEGATGMEIINSTFVLTLSTTDPDYFPSTQGFDDFTSTITENNAGTIAGTFGGIVSNSSGADLSVTQGVIDIAY